MKKPDIFFIIVIILLLVNLSLFSYYVYRPEHQSTPKTMLSLEGIVLDNDGNITLKTPTQFKTIKISNKNNIPVKDAGTFYIRAENGYELIDFHHYRFYYLKFVISAFAVVIFIILFFREWKITSRGFKSA